MGGLLGLAGGLLAERKQHLAKRKPGLGGFAGGKVADRCLRAACGLGDLRLSPALAGLDVGDNVFPLHGCNDNVFPLFVQRFSGIGNP